MSRVTEDRARVAKTVRYLREWVWTLDDGIRFVVQCPDHLSTDELAEVKELLALFQRQMERQIREKYGVGAAALEKPE